MKRSRKAICNLLLGPVKSLVAASCRSPKSRVDLENHWTVKYDAQIWDSTEQKSRKTHWYSNLPKRNIKGARYRPPTYHNKTPKKKEASRVAILVSVTLSSTLNWCNFAIETMIYPMILMDKVVENSSTKINYLSLQKYSRLNAQSKQTLLL